MCEFLVVCFTVFIQCVCDAFAMVYFLLGEVAVDLDNCIVFCCLLAKWRLVTWQINRIWFDWFDQPMAIVTQRPLSSQLWVAIANLPVAIADQSMAIVSQRPLSSQLWVAIANQFILDKMGKGNLLCRYCYWGHVIKVCSSPILSYNQVWELENSFSSLSNSYFKSKLQLVLKTVKLKFSLADEAFLLVKFCSTMCKAVCCADMSWNFFL